MMQKLLQIGSSAGVTIPKKSLKDLGLTIGDEVIVEIDKKRESVSIRSARKVDRELLDWTDKFIEKYRPALEALAKK
jgi:putative addiction module antidote